MAVEDALPMDLGEMVIAYQRQSVKAERQFINKEFWLIFDHLPQGKELVFAPWSPEQWELVVELAGRRRNSLLSWESAPFLSLYQTAAWGKLWRQHSALCFGNREEGI